MKKANKSVLLINPWIYDFAAYDLWVKPLGLLYIAGVLRRNGYDIHFIDCLVRKNPQVNKEGIEHGTRNKYGSGHFLKEHIEKPEALKEIPRNYRRYGIGVEAFEQELLKLSKPDVILVTSMMTYWYMGVFQAIALCKKIYPDVPVILGGIYTTLCPEHALHYSGADYYIYGEGEVSALKLIREITQSSTSFIPVLKDLDSLPYPAFDLMEDLNSLAILTSRGCPNKCTYCASSLLHNTLRQRNYLKVVEEIAYWINNYPVKNIAFYDDALLYKAEERFIPLLRKLIRMNTGCTFHIPNGLHVSRITEEIASLLFQASCKTIRVGLETAIEERQTQTEGKTTNKDFERAVTQLWKAGYNPEDIGAYLLVGIPGQKVEEVRESIQFVMDCGARPFLAEYSPIPGTDLWQNAIGTSPFDLIKEPLFHNNSILPCRSNVLTWKHLYQLRNEVKLSQQ